MAGTTHLNWKYARQSLINQNFVNSVANYVFRGFKMSEFRSYEKVEPLLAACNPVVIQSKKSLKNKSSSTTSGWECF